MSRYIQIASLNPCPLSDDPLKSNQELLETLISYWDLEFENVIYNKPDIILLYEASDRFSNFTHERNVDFNTYKGDKFLNYLKDKARSNNCYIIYPYLKTMEDGSNRNCADLIDRKGEIVGSYNKNYPVDSEMFAKNIKAGDDAPIFQCDFGKIAITICFDLNFTSLMEKYKEGKPEIMFFASMYHGGFVQQNWAYEVGSYFVSSVALTDSSVLSPVGEIIAYSTNYSRYFTTKINLDYKVIHLDNNWEKILSVKKKYGNKVLFKDPGKIGVVLMTCETDEFTCDDVLKEFEIQTAVEYFTYSKEIRKDYIE